MDGSIAGRLAVQAQAAHLVADALIDALNRIEEYEESLPRLLICTDLESGEQTYSGPIPTRELADQILEHEIRSAGRDSALKFSLAPLYPALDPRDISGRAALLLSGPTPPKQRGPAASGL